MIRNKPEQQARAYKYILPARMRMIVIPLESIDYSEQHIKSLDIPRAYKKV